MGSAKHRSGFIFCINSMFELSENPKLNDENTNRNITDVSSPGAINSRLVYGREMGIYFDKSRFSYSKIENV